MVCLNTVYCCYTVFHGGFPHQSYCNIIKLWYAINFAINRLIAFFTSINRLIAFEILRLISHSTLKDASSLMEVTGFFIGHPAPSGLFFPPVERLILSHWEAWTGSNFWNPQLMRNQLHLHYCPNLRHLPNQTPSVACWCYSARPRGLA